MNRWTKLLEMRKCWLRETNGNIGYEIGGVGKVHGGFGIEQDKDGGVRVIDWVMFDEYVSRKGNVDI